jgi:phosphate starvation-inducible PhoH-like protein
VSPARAVVDELVELVEGGHEIGPDTVGAVLAALDQVEDVRDVFDDVVWRHRGKNITPKTVNQKRYVDAIREATVTFGIGPAGTGKTYLAMALAVSALSEGAVGRVILTRPAVEAGERLGFLPGDMLAKVDPYLRPLFDALRRCSTPSAGRTWSAARSRSRRFAFMRGRTLNDSFIVLDGPEHDSRADADVLTRLGSAEDGRDRGRDAVTSRERASGPSRCRDPRRDRSSIGFRSSSATRTSCATLVQRIVEGVQGPRRGDGHGQAPVIAVETTNRSGLAVEAR